MDIKSVLAAGGAISAADVASWNQETRDAAAWVAKKLPEMMVASGSDGDDGRLCFDIVPHAVSYHAMTLGLLALALASTNALRSRLVPDTERVLESLLARGKAVLAGVVQNPSALVDQAAVVEDLVQRSLNALAELETSDVAAAADAARVMTALLHARGPSAALLTAWLSRFRDLKLGTPPPQDVELLTTHVMVYHVFSQINVCSITGLQRTKDAERIIDVIVHNPPAEFQKFGASDSTDSIAAFTLNIIRVTLAASATRSEIESLGTFGNANCIASAKPLEDFFRFAEESDMLSVGYTIDQMTTAVCAFEEWKEDERAKRPGNRGKIKKTSTTQRKQLAKGAKDDMKDKGAKRASSPPRAKAKRGRTGRK